MDVFFVSLKNKLFCKRSNKEEKSLKKRNATKIAALICGVVLMALSLWVLYASSHLPLYSCCEGVGKYSFCAESKNNREDFFDQFGYEAKEVESFEVIIPSQGEVLQEYNEIQKKHGMNILPYGDKKARMYVYEISKDDLCYGFLTVYKDRVVGAHISDCEYPASIKSLAP